jgi:hypothetical protein
LVPRLADSVLAHLGRREALRTGLRQCPAPDRQLRPAA